MIHELCTLVFERVAEGPGKWWHVAPARDDIVKDARGYTTYIRPESKGVYCVYDKTNHIYWHLYKPFRDSQQREGHVLQFDVSQRKYKAVVRMADGRQTVLQLKDIVPTEEQVSEEKEKELRAHAEEYLVRQQEKNAIFALSRRKEKRRRKSPLDEEEFESDEDAPKRLRTGRRLPVRYAVSNSEEEEECGQQEILQFMRNQAHTANGDANVLRNGIHNGENGKKEVEYINEIRALRERVSLLENVLQTVFDNLQSGIKLVKKFASKK